jgi:hypothetical protein
MEKYSSCDYVKDGHYASLGATCLNSTSTFKDPHGVNIVNKNWCSNSS